MIQQYCYHFLLLIQIHVDNFGNEALLYTIDLSSTDTIDDDCNSQSDVSIGSVGLQLIGL